MGILVIVFCTGNHLFELPNVLDRGMYPLLMVALIPFDAEFMHETCSIQGDTRNS